VNATQQTVLVVDDDAAIRMLCRLNLELDGWRVLEGASIPQAREQLADESVAVVVLDVHVGLGSGIEFLQELRRERPHLKVAMLTGSDRIGELKSDAVIPKPFTIDQLTSTVAGLAAQQA